MALNKDRLKEKIKQAWLSEIENEDENQFLDLRIYYPLYY